MGLRTREDINDMTLLQTVTEQLLIIVNEHSKNPELNVDFVQTICDHIYKHLNNCLNSKPDLKQFIQSTFSERRIVWVEHRFEFPSRVAFNHEYNCQPHLFRLQSHLSKHRLFFEVVGVKDNFDVTDILAVFEEILISYGGKELPSDTMDIVPRLAQLLRDALVNTGQNSLQDDRKLYLPDRHRYLQPVSLLCLDDCDWLSESDTMKFVHDSISPAVARKLGVSSKRKCDFDEMCDSIPFGQHERLTTRIKRLLEGYTFDSSVFKELIQNADDAGATEIKFIKDFRHHKTDKIPVGWENLQGPALCVFNNKSFTSADMEGIKNVGLGSKGQDLLKTGKYGVGFNAVYHITDVPSFWTREDDKEEVICVFDPNCRYLPNISLSNPGSKIKNISRLQQNYPDMFGGYLAKCIDMTKSGTLFRLPLRTSLMASQSESKTLLWKLVN
ncbi:hypothetical protein C0Q70_20773 [Pomacea canaliculata]|uniref:Sacsin/Nov domain-containing protein n=1 Tax=Pomacea canaliculata TaxID=400727 RepID=A0A2T7NGJ2_POMCA|nr:hypothetical protein C0Q70_20773 [Pomacea canaliculata]